MPRARDDILEFKCGPKRGKGLRVLWFYDEGAPAFRCTIICAVWAHKRDEDLAAEKKTTNRLRKAYIEAKKRRRLEILD